MGGYKGIYYQINETNISGEYTIDLQDQSHTVAAVEVTGNTTFSLSGTKFNQKCYLLIKINGSVSSLRFNSQFCTEAGIAPDLELSDGALNLIEFVFTESHNTAVIYKVAKDVKAIS